MIMLRAFLPILTAALSAMPRLASAQQEFAVYSLSVPQLGSGYDAVAGASLSGCVARTDTVSESRNGVVGDFRVMASRDQVGSTMNLDGPPPAS
ncbi:MAG TPA: hypothetical protein VK636_16900 [Gemmatimonadaceae bacterium]|nr:hypothetical protein [Gemmatimonadaceae bacterium]